METQNKQQLLDEIKQLSETILQAQENRRLLRHELNKIEANERLLTKSKRESQKLAEREIANEQKIEKYLQEHKFINNLRQQGLTFREIGKQMNLSGTRVSQKLARGERFLKRREQQKDR